MRQTALLIAAIMLFSLSSCGTGTEAMEGSLLEHVTPAETGSASEAAEPVADFAASILSELYDGGDVLISPVSILTVLAMAEAGAEGETLAQMENVLGADAKTMQLALSAYMQTVEDTAAKMANSIWVREDVGLEPDTDFLSVCASFAGADVFARAFHEATRIEINEWASSHTDGMITDILDEISSDAMMYLVNAVAFEADWEEPYESSQVSDAVFHAADGDKMVEMLYCDAPVYLEGDGFTGFMKYYDGKRCAFAVLLPDEEAGLDGLAAALTGEMICTALENAENTLVETAMPGFSSGYELDFRDTLMTKGIVDAFDEELADFSGMGLGPVYMNRVLHKTFIEVTPLGTRAGAATAAEMNVGGAPEKKRVIADRPFIYMIVDTEYNIPIFIGTMTGEAE